MERKLVEVAWEVTDRCNYDCIHCYNPRKREDLSYSKVVNILNQLKTMGVDKIKYGGGEPLLRPDFLEILKSTISMGFDSSFSTNGFLIDSQIVKEIKKTGLSRVQVSLDGNEEIHNIVRNNRFAYSRAINAISLFVSNGFNVSVATTLIKTNLNCLEEIFHDCSLNGVNRWRVMKYIPFSRKDLTPSPGEYLQAHEKLLELKSKSKSMEVYVAREFNEVCEKKDRFDAECFGGRSVLSIRANGDISHCSYFPSLIVGNVRNKSIEELWNSQEMLEFAGEVYGDKNCPHFKFCQGGCKAANFFIEKNKGCDPYCWIKMKNETV